MNYSQSSRSLTVHLMGGLGRIASSFSQSMDLKTGQEIIILWLTSTPFKPLPRRTTNYSRQARLAPTSRKQRKSKMKMQLPQNNVQYEQDFNRFEQPSTTVIMDMINTQNIELLFEEPPLLIKDYDALDLKVGLLRGIYGYGFEKMSEVQQKSLPVIIRGRDIIVQAQSGTGKTATHAIGALQRIDETSQECQVMVLCPTRELAHGIGRLYEMIGEFIGVRTRLVIGGVPMATQHDLQNKGFHVVVGTCGRMLDVINRKFLDISKVRVLVMDELDEMISRGFKEQMLEIMKLLPKQTQTIVCSATIPTEMVQMMINWMSSPVRVNVRRQELTLEGIKQYYVNVERQQWKLQCLIELFQMAQIAQTIVYVNKSAGVLNLVNILKNHPSNMSVVGIHALMDTIERGQAAKKFRTGEARMLVCSQPLRDVTCGISVFINFEIPTINENYLSRIGRSGCYGRKGVAINFITREQAHRIRELQMFYQTNINELPMDLTNIF